MDLIAHPHLDGGFTHRLRTVGPHRDMVAIDGEEQLGVVIEHPADEQRQGGLGRLVFVPGVFPVLDLGGDGLGLRLARGQLEAQLGGLHQDVGSARHVTDEHAAVITHRLWGDVLVAASHALDGMHVDAALVSEGGLPDPWLARVMAHVGHAVHKFGQLLELG